MTAINPPHHRADSSSLCRSGLRQPEGESAHPCRHVLSLHLRSLHNHFLLVSRDRNVQSNSLRSFLSFGGRAMRTSAAEHPAALLLTSPSVIITTLIRRVKTKRGSRVLPKRWPEVSWWETLMATAGLSLVGFMPQDQAIRYLGNVCVPANADSLALFGRVEVAACAGWRGLPTPGVAAVDNIPSPTTMRICKRRQLFRGCALPCSRMGLQTGGHRPALGVSVPCGLGQIGQPFRRLAAPPYSGGRTATLHSARNLPAAVCHRRRPKPRPCHQDAEFRPPNNGQRPNPKRAKRIRDSARMGALRSYRLLRCNGRCYLTNGFHRTFGLRRARSAASPLPVWEVADFNELGVPGGNDSFDKPLLESADPPTFAHFANGRAYDVQLRRASRVIHASWSDYFVPEE